MFTDHCRHLFENYDNNIYDKLEQAIYSVALPNYDRLSNDVKICIYKGKGYDLVKIRTKI